MSRWTKFRDRAENVASVATAPFTGGLGSKLTSRGAQSGLGGRIADLYGKAYTAADIMGGLAGGAMLAPGIGAAAPEMGGLGMSAGVDAAGSAALGDILPSTIGEGIYGAGAGATGAAGASAASGAGLGNLGLAGVSHAIGGMGWPGVIGGLGVLSAINSYQNRKAIQKQNDQARADMAARQHQIDVNPISGTNAVDPFGRSMPTHTTPFYGTPSYDPFHAQDPSQRLAFGPTPWQVGGSPPPTQAAEGGVMHMLAGGPHMPTHSGTTGPLGLLARGPGGGQADQIPAMLSDGEYVMDAGTVSDLGDGSTDEGARRLDKMRESVRKHKRTNVSPKSIPPKAKAPESYLKGKRK